MKKYAMSLILLLNGVMTTYAAPTNPTSTIVKIFEIRASKHSDCSGAVTIFKTASPTSVDLVTNPTFGSGAIPDAVYHCLMFHIGDLVSVTPQATDGLCTSGVPETIDIFRDSSNDLSVSPDGVTIHANPGVEDDPWLYFSDSSLAAPTNNCFEPNFSGCACSGPCPLTPITLNSDQTHTLVLNLDTRVDGSGSSCTLLLPPGPNTAFSIR